MKYALLLIFLPFFLHSQDIISKRITTDDGLPSSEVYCIEQDNEGYIWIGTDNGLVKYDGRTFEVFSDKKGLSNNTILDFNKDFDGRLWLTTLKGKIFYLENGKVFDYDFSLLSPQTEDMSYKGLTLLGTDKDGKRWITNDINSFLLEEKGNSVFERINFHTDSLGTSINYYVKSIGNKSIISQSARTNEKVAEGYSISSYKDYIVLQLSSYNHLEAARYDYRFNKLRNGTLIGYNTGGDYVVFTKEKILSHGNFNISEVINLYEDRDANIWLVTTGGVFLFEKGNLENKPNEFLKNQFITDMIQDGEGNYWFTDRSKGLHKVTSINFRYYQYSHSYLENRVASLKVRNGKLWMSTIDGKISAIDKQFNVKQVFEDNRIKSDYYPFDISRDGTLFLPGGRLVKNGRQLRKDFLTFNTFKCIEKYGEDTFFSGLTEGISKYSISENQAYKSSPTKGANVKVFTRNFQDRVNALVKLGDTLWLGATEGLYWTTLDSVYYLGDKNPLLTNRIMSIKPFSRNVLILGTKEIGVLFFNKLTNETVRLTSEDGLISNSIKSIYVKGRRIFVGTNRGLSIVEVDEEFNIISIRNYNIYNGLPSNEICDINEFEGKLWLATNNSLVYLDEKKLRRNNFSPPVKILNVKTKDSVYDLSDTHVQLTANERNITFTYNGIGYRTGGQINYKCFLGGFIQDTIYTSSEEVRYTNLSPGNHTFYVWAQNEDKYWSTTPTEISVFIPKQFKETKLFLILMYLLSLIILIGLVVYFNRRNKNKLKDSINTIELKQQALTALMNPHFIHNSLAAIQHFINKGEDKKSSIYLSRFSKLIRLNLNSVREGTIQLEDEIDRLKLYLEIEKMRFGDKLSYKIEIDDQIDILGIEIPSMLLQPFVENAIWHGILPNKKPGLVQINFDIKKENSLEVHIRDNGVGIYKSIEDSSDKQHTSLSMDITNERLKLLQEKTKEEYVLKVDQLYAKDGGGTLVYLKIPIL